MYLITKGSEGTETGSGNRNRTAMPFGHPAASQPSLRLAIIKSFILKHVTASEKQDGQVQLLVATAVSWVHF